MAGWKDLEWTESFLRALSETANVKQACEASGIARQTAYETRARYKAFRSAWEKAEQCATKTVLEPEAVRRAVEGVQKPIYYKGKRVGRVREYSDTLLIFLLKAHDPERYKDRSAHELTGKDGGPIETATRVHIYLPDNGRG